MTKDNIRESTRHTPQGGCSAKPTPGPWRVKNRGDGAFLVAAEDGITVSASTQRDPGENKANATIQAAAPDLLAACEQLVVDSECYCLSGAEGAGRGPCGYCLAKAAIAKARVDK